MTIHYATGGLITPEKAEFSTLCHRKFPSGGSDIMQSGMIGAQNTTCKDCRRILDKGEAERKHRVEIENAMARGEWSRIKFI